ncbi:hypothetical protein DL96DRAFT_1701794 [Flagelloscypha sp. PMI_526]|nr:hypothetical protein DL96DRAFT_1701794 [Flagelloscypha sp. PMI_526]
MSTAPPEGIYVPSVLFFDEKGEFDVPSIESHVLRLAKGGVTGILVQGSNGEAQHLNPEERKAAIKLTRETLNKNGYANVAVIAGCGVQSTRETIKLTRDAQEAGATHALNLTPSTWVPAMNPDTIIAFHQEVASASPIPVLIYNFPVVTAGLDLDSDVLSKLAVHPNIVGVKLSDGNIGKIHRLTSRFSPSSFAVLPGKADVLLHALLSGCPGGILALANIVPKVHSKLVGLFKEGRLSEALTLQAKMGHADWAVTKLGGIGGVKLVVTENFDYGKPFVRGPLRTKSASSLVGDAHYGALQELIALEKELPDIAPHTQ